MGRTDNFILCEQSLQTKTLQSNAGLPSLTSKSK